MLYYFGSSDYLKALHRLVSELLNGVIDPLLDMAKLQNRDQVLVSQVWGDRNTAANWANCAWPFLKDLQASLAKDIALRASGRFDPTSVDENLRGIDEYSVDWTTPDEERVLKLALQTINDHAAPLDRTLVSIENRWNDFRFAYSYHSFAAYHRQIPKFVVHYDVSSQTGEMPPRTGVYVSVDDPHASLQFAWTGDRGCKLRKANTFNDIGLAALSAVGREALWFDEQKMFDFAMSKHFVTRFRNDVILDGIPYPSLAPSAVARTAFKTCSCKWAFVEIIDGEFEDLNSMAEQDATPMITPARIVGGGQCVKAGFYFTPSSPNSRRFFSTGEITPNLASPYGSTFWQLDADQKE